MTLLRKKNRLTSVLLMNSSEFLTFMSLENQLFTLLINSKARLQAIAFICKPEYLKTVNFNTQTVNLVEVLRDMTRLEWFEGQSASWNKIYGAPFSVRLTPFGYCFTFNIINATDLMNINE